MKMKKTVMAFLIIFSFFSCNEKEILRNHKLTGIWIYENSEKEEVQFKKKIKFNSNNESGIRLKQNGQLMKLQYVEWGGTPPIAYGYYDGIWKLSKDSIVAIKYEYWGGKIEEDWKIIVVNEKELKMNMINRKTIEKE